MAIVYDEKQRVFGLHTKNTSYLIGLADSCGYVGHVYYGKRMDDLNGS